MARRATFGAAGGSPFRVSVAGVDANSAYLDNVIFDANAPPLRLGQVWVTSAPAVDHNGTMAYGSSIPLSFNTPSGTHPIFLVNGRLWSQRFGNGVAAGAEVNVNADWNATSGDAQILNKPTIPPDLGFTPVQQGGGAGQLTNKLHFGWSGSVLKAQVDTTDLGRVWCDAEAPRAIATNGYQKLPSGLILQWGFRASPSGGAAITFPITFPNECVGVWGVSRAYNVAACLGFTAELVSTSGFTCRPQFSSSGSVGVANEPVSWFAIGW